ncbi:carbon starvation protein A [candidate division KSB1 bacterium]|nr:carbon starvation protein A [candidate division KSB1 bacterium]
MLFILLSSAVVIFAIAYRFYGGFLKKQFELDDSHVTPSHTDYDGVDRVPAHRAVLLGHHFSSIAGAGPIVGPIIAAVAFGWMPTLLWILFGAIFIGGVHDFASLMASIRHKARSIAQIAKEYMSPLAYHLLLAFIWLTLVYVLTVFMDLTSTTFVQDGGVATSAALFILFALGFGVAIYRFKLPVLWASIIFVPLIFMATYLGHLLPLKADILPALISDHPAKTWNVILLLYCFIASTTPVWILLQPRDYLSSYLLYASVLGGFIGILFGGYSLNYEAFAAWYAPGLGALFPILFITVACGACSGFHSVVASGTSSKQLNKESDARPIGYGAMLIEAVVAVIALSTVAMLPMGDPLTARVPLVVYGAGMGKFLSVLGIPEELGSAFGLLALSTFILTTLDTATRLARYIFEEFFQIKGTLARYSATLVSLILPAVFVLITLKDAQGNPMPAWKAIWPVFGATNQLLAGLTLLVILVWLKKTGKRTLYILLPVLFMNVMTIWALAQLIDQYGFSTVGVIAMVLMALAWVLIFEAVRTYRRVLRSGWVY